MPLNKQPYKNIDWNNANLVKSATHHHIYPYWREPSQEQKNEELLSMYLRGLNHVNYSDHNLQDSFGLPASPPIYPLNEWFTEIPSNVIGTPGTERMWTSAEHYPTIGCTYKSDDDTVYRDSEVYNTRQELYDTLKSHLILPDGGGWHFAHFANYNTIRNSLLMGYDELLGMEVYNHKYRDGTGESRGRNDETWDNILKDGLQCYGFWNPDYYGMWEEETPKGVNTLLIEGEVTQEKILRAYRKGEFFGSLLGVQSFEYINNGDQSISAKVTGNPDDVLVITNNTETAYSGNEIIHHLSANDHYYRIQANYLNGDKLYSQATFVNQLEENQNRKRFIAIFGE